MKRLIQTALVVCFVAMQWLPSFAVEYELNVPVAEIKVTYAEFDDLTLGVFADGTISDSSGTVDFYILSNEQERLVAKHIENEDVLVYLYIEDFDGNGLYWVNKTDINTPESKYYKLTDLQNKNIELYRVADDTVYQYSFLEETLSVGQSIASKPEGDYQLAIIRNQPRERMILVWVASYYVKEIAESSSQISTYVPETSSSQTPENQLTQPTQMVDPTVERMPESTEATRVEVLSPWVLVIELFVISILIIVILILIFRRIRASAKDIKNELSDANTQTITISKTKEMSDKSSLEILNKILGKVQELSLPDRKKIEDNFSDIARLLKTPPKNEDIFKIQEIAGRIETILDNNKLRSKEQDEIENLKDRLDAFKEAFRCEKDTRIELEKRLNEALQQTADNDIQRIFTLIFEKHLDPSSWQKEYEKSGYTVIWLTRSIAVGQDERYSPARDSGSYSELAAVSKGDYIYVIPTCYIIDGYTGNISNQKISGASVAYWYSGVPCSNQSLCLAIPALAEKDMSSYSCKRKGELG